MTRPRKPRKGSVTPSAKARRKPDAFEKALLEQIEYEKVYFGVWQEILLRKVLEKYRAFKRRKKK